MSSINFVFEAPPHPDQEQQAANFRTKVETIWPGSIVKFAHHPMGSMRARVSLPDEQALYGMYARLYLNLLDEKFRVYVDCYGNRGLV
jgi:hypothetical protein